MNILTKLLNLSKIHVLEVIQKPEDRPIFNNFLIKKKFCHKII